MGGLPLSDLARQYGTPLYVYDAAPIRQRIADLATNISEDVIFLVDGEVVRHHPEKFA